MLQKEAPWEFENLSKESGKDTGRKNSKIGNLLKRRCI